MNEDVKITADNWEEFLFLHLDGELPPAAERAFRQWVAEHPEAAAELAAYGQLRLQPDESIGYAGKDALLRPEAPVMGRVVPLHRRRWAFAAAAGLLLFFSAAAVWQFQQEGPKDSTLAWVNPNGTMRPSEVEGSQPAKTKKAPARPRIKTPSPKLPEAATRRPGTPGAVRLAAAPVRRQPEALAPVEALPASLPVPAYAMAAAEPAPVLAPSLPGGSGPATREWSAMPVIDAPVALAIRDEASERWQKIRRRAGELKDASVALRIGNKDLLNIHL